jgi:hypothetical protein
LELPPAAWEQYAARDETRREHAFEAQAALALRGFTVTEYRGLRAWLTELAMRTQKATALAEQLIERLRTIRIVVPSAHVIDRAERSLGAWHPSAVSDLDRSSGSTAGPTRCPPYATAGVAHHRIHVVASTTGEAKPGPLLRHLERIDGYASIDRCTKWRR